MLRTMKGTPARTRSLGIAAALLLGLGSLGSDCFPVDGGTDAGTPAAANSPSVEVTVDGTHVGPAPALSGSFADLTAAHDAFGGTTTTDLVIHAVAANASCDLHFDRFGAQTQPFGPSVTTLATPTGSATAGGTTSTVGPLTVVAGQLTLQCSGSNCDGGVFNIRTMDATHIEGFVSSTFADPNDGQTSATVCSFYVPFRTYAP
jgi:hypothetical protein